MRILLILLLLTLSPIVSTEEIAPVRTHLVILAGQSNMAGLDPAISFTPTITVALAPDNVLVVKDAEGGRPIRMWYKDWKPSVGNRPAATGELYDRLIAKVRHVIENKKVDTVTFVWMQGERDAKEGHGAQYAESLKGLTAQLEKDLCRSDLFVVLGRLSDHGVDNPQIPDWNVVRKAQVTAAEENPRWEWVDTDDLNGSDDNLHYTREGYRELGARFAEKAVNLIRNNTPPPGNCRATLQP